ncbi:SDR family oxidoreductase [Actinacidiphila bryophytorum]|uniref:NADP-dependent 3-hydroxy acid dehydrogenase YdfG n=1 Tax=Actinacidiphila bryophytorum TaxID=1436133 RepID=A0A9W4MII5_9ACTN|nr:SDR family oxidoreductase [Actinacidiphila bryophytorum]MBM9440825.1 SDR family oxidoreductase [Actinacidiphila bryophytorum]MBN6546171.1 SDR family oxidoreductase [Actinacidiphila bryophytorum]CAG7647145.1 NADP-dependent 3-hydroxy acid dehydrogenase YdfG [Actinacidiphila bryophytorum]
MSVRQPAGNTVVVTGVGRGFGRGTAVAFAGAGARVVGLARDAESLEKLQAELGDAFVPVRGDATDPDLAAELLTRYTPAAVVLNAGAAPVMRPLQDHTWETFRIAWDVDVQQAFHWARAALRLPLPPGSTVVSLSSGAALRGSPLSGGYAGAKATVRFVSEYAAAESLRQALGIRFRAVLPALSPTTDLGTEAAAAYAAYQGVGTDAFVRAMGPLLTPDMAGAAMVSLAAEEDGDALAFTLSAAGLQPV